MINHIYGKVSYVGKNYILLESYGIGYKINTPLLDDINVNENKRFYLHSIIKTDIKNNISCEMYGFINPIQRSLFADLLTVKGIGPIIAANILSIGHQQVIEAIYNEDIESLKLIKSISEKQAKEIIFNLYDKYKKLVSTNTIKVSKSNNNEVISALKQLGYSDEDVKLALSRIDNLLGLDENIGNCIRFIASQHENANS